MLLHILKQDISIAPLITHSVFFKFLLFAQVDVNIVSYPNPLYLLSSQVEREVKYDPDNPQEGQQHVKAVPSTGPVALRGQCNHLYHHLYQLTQGMKYHLSGYLFSFFMCHKTC